MVKLRRVTEETFDLWRYKKTTHDKMWPYHWVVDCFETWPDSRACVPATITGLKDFVSQVYHTMKVDCACPENSNATVVCLAEIDGPHGPEYVKCFHKPGQCPHLTYEALPTTGPTTGPTTWLADDTT